MNLIIRLPKKQLDGQITAVDLDLQTLQPVTILAVKFAISARVLLFQEMTDRDKAIFSNVQYTTTYVHGCALHLCSNIIWSDFDLTKPYKLEQRHWLRFPQVWQPVTVQANNKEGKLFCMVEARAGNPKHKAEIEITLQVKHGK